MRRRFHEPSRSPSPTPDAPGYGRYRTLGRSRPEPQDQPRRLEGDSVPSRFRDRNDDHASLRGQEAGLADPEDSRCRAWSCTAKKSVPGCSGRGSSAWTRPNSSSPATSSATRTSRLTLRRGTSWDLTGVINQIRLIFDGTTSVQAPWGVLVVEKRSQPRARLAHVPKVEKGHALQRHTLLVGRRWIQP